MKFRENIQNWWRGQDKQYFILVTLGIALILLVVSPTLNSGLVSDDSFYSIFSQVTGNNLPELLTNYFQIVSIQIKEQIAFGRLNILPILYVPIFVSLTAYNVVLYKIILLMLIGLNVFLFLKLLFRIQKNGSLGLITLLLFPLLFQIRSFPDPLVSFYGGMQIIVLLLLLSLLNLHSFLTTAKKRYYIGSIVFFILCLMCYEITYIFFIFPIIFIYFLSDKKKFLRTLILSIPYILAGIIFLVTTLLLMRYHTREYVGLSVQSGNLPLIVSTFFKQIIAAMPLSYFFGYPWFAFMKNTADIFHNFHYFWVNFSFWSIALIGGYITLFFKACLYIKDHSKPAVDGKPKAKSTYVLFLFLTGVSFLVLPVPTVAISQKYQEALAPVWGLGYLPVYISYFGTAILLGLLFQSIILKAQSWKPLFYRGMIGIFAVLLGIGALINYSNNIMIVDGLNHVFKYPRFFVMNAARNNLFSSAKDNAYLYVDNNYTWEELFPKLFYTRLLGQSQFKNILYDKTILLPENKTMLGFPANGVGTISGNLHYLKYDAVSDQLGYAVFSKVQNISIGTNSKTEMYGTDVYVYVQDYMRQHAISVVGNWRDDQQYSSPTVFAWKGTDFTIAASGPDWVLYRKQTTKIVDLKSIVVAVWEGNVGSSLVNDTYIIGNLISHSDDTYFSYGWSPNEKIHRWSKEKKAEVTIKLGLLDPSFKHFKFMLRPTLTSGTQTVTISINGTSIGQMVFDGHYTVGQYLDFDASLLKSNSYNSIVFDIPNAQPEAGVGPRQLGIDLGDMGIYPSQ